MGCEEGVGSVFFVLFFIVGLGWGKYFMCCFKLYIWFVFIGGKF